MELFLLVIIGAALAIYISSVARKPPPTPPQELKVEVKDTSNMERVIRILKPVLHPDPVKMCVVHKTEGCSHVDGFLCEPSTCTMRLEAEKKKQETVKE